MAAAVSLTNHKPFQPVWTPSRKLRDHHPPPRHAARKRGVDRPMEYIDPGRAELRSVLVRTNAVMHRTQSGQNYEKAVKVVNAEYWKPPKVQPGAWFPNADQVFDLRKGEVDAAKVNHLCDILEHLPFLFKAIDRIKISWLRNNYPLPLRIVRALDRDDFELISSNFSTPIGDVNRYPGAMWSMNPDGSLPAPNAKRPTLPGQPQRERRDTVARHSGPFNKSALTSDPTAVPKTIVPHRRDWNRLVHRYLDDCVSALRPTGPRTTAGPGGVRPDRVSMKTSGGADRLSTAGGQRRQSSMETEQAAAVAAAAAAAADAVAWQAGRSDRPFSRLMEPLYPPWQLVEEAEEGDRRISNLSTVSAEDAKLIMKRCCQLKSKVLSQMDQQYKAKIHKLEDNREQRYRRKVSYLVPPYRTANADMPAIRRRVQARSRMEDVTLRSAPWYGRLLRLSSALGADGVPRCGEMLERLLPYSRRDGCQASRGSEKLCLLLMSIPYYEALRADLQMAVLFVHVHFLRGSENVFRRWLEARSLMDATRSSPLYGLLHGEELVLGASEHSTSSEDEDSA